uniref:NADH dehydrogenase subunit 1 n=1 Tax=Hygrobates turcicus TaxID=2028090 RepID=UPI002237B886|nr:NADH dehydrogenase subunit 1 [Hygrobates turcicus]UYS90932.1 NADH dehydrogenase subunit 1 [Hygrobates turcicus]
MMNFIAMLIFMLISIAFFTLFEVKALGAMHLRPGPDKVFISGILQPISDFLKLFFKAEVHLMTSFFMAYVVSPALGVTLGIFIWVNYLSEFPFFSFCWGVLLLFVISSISVYTLLFSGIFSGTFYSKAGAFRAAIQAVSYEVSMIFLFFSFIFLISTFSFFDFFLEGNKVYMFLLSPPLFCCWILSCLAETGRAPFDFIEGESELVSGFNTEYYSEMFIFIFLGEYSFILFLCFITASLTGIKMMMLKTFLFCFTFIWVRASFPRFRFDKLMSFCWKSILPLSLGGVFFFYMNFITR